jgi:hypothetical protein
MKLPIKPIEPNEIKDVAMDAFLGYPPYPVSEDVYNQLVEEQEVDPDDVATKKAPVYSEEEELEPGDHANKAATFLDVPGSELDDAQENIGNEDEENNFYSLGNNEQDDQDEELT